MELMDAKENGSDGVSDLGDATAPDNLEIFENTLNGDPSECTHQRWSSHVTYYLKSLACKTIISFKQIMERQEPISFLRELIYLMNCLEITVHIPKNGAVLARVFYIAVKQVEGILIR